MNTIINEKILGLNYDPEQILAFRGDEVKFVPYEGTLNGDKYIVTKKEKHSIDKSNIDIAVVTGMTDRTFPGALLLANENLVNNMPDVLNAKRAPLTLRSNLPMGDDGTTIVDNPTNSSISEAINKILKAWEDNYAATHTLNANCQYTEIKAYSKDQLTVELGCNFDLLQSALNIDFKAISENKKQVFLLSFRQIFYMMSVDTPNNPGDVFAEDVTWDELGQKGLNEQNPPALIGNVSYGRIIYVKAETSSKDLNIEATLKALIKDNKIDPSANYNEELKDCTFTTVIMGGDAAANTQIINNQKIEDIQKIIAENAEFGAKNPGFPISHTASFLKDGKVAKVNSSTDYIETTTTEYSSGSVRLHHTGAYVAKFYITWDESSYDDKGAQKLDPKSWEKNDQGLTAGFDTVISLPANTVNLHIKATENTGLAWEGWRTIIDQNANLNPEVLVEIWGTTLNQKGSVTYK